MSGPTILLMAGELSGDQHGAVLAGALRERHPGVRLIGTGGDRMKGEGVELIAELPELAVMGFAEVLPRIPYFWRLERRVKRVIESERVDLVVLIDFPGFNMRVARAAHERGALVLYYIAPKVWAWRKERAYSLAETTDRVAVILPFEADFLRDFGVDARYVGHPLLDRPHDVASRGDFFEEWGLDPTRPVLAMLPGSRAQELGRHIGPFTRIAERVVQARPDVLPVFSRAEAMHAAPFHRTGFPVVTDTRALLRHASAALVKSGTSTLEAVIEDTPLVVAYRAHPLTVAAGRRLMLVKHFGLPNLIADEPLFPEFLQKQVEPDVVAPVLLDLLEEESDARAQQLECMVRIRTDLGEAGAAGRVADLASELLEGRNGEVV